MWRKIVLIKLFSSHSITRHAQFHLPYRRTMSSHSDWLARRLASVASEIDLIIVSENSWFESCLGKFQKLFNVLFESSNY
jgi:hypothetical protein